LTMTTLKAHCYRERRPCEGHDRRPLNRQRVEVADDLPQILLHQTAGPFRANARGGHMTPHLRLLKFQPRRPAQQCVVQTLIADLQFLSLKRPVFVMELARLVGDLRAKGLNEKAGR
jgi:hypothetical protein